MASSFLSILVALPFSSAFSAIPRNVASSTRRFSSTMELAPTAVLTQQEEEDMFSDFPSLDEMEQQPMDDNALFEEVNNKKLTNIHVTEITQAEATLSSAPTKAPRPSMESTSSPRASVQAAVVKEQEEDTHQPTLLSSPRKRLMEETGKRRVTAKVRETGHESMRNYIKTMCNHELLNKNEEIILAREIQILIKWEESREELESQLLRYVYL